MKMSKSTVHETAQQIRKIRWINLLLLAGILLVLNILGTNLFLRWDMTGRGIYSLSSASKDIVRNLEDRLTIRAFFSEDLPPEVASVGRYVKDKLDDYKAYGRQKIHFEFVDPSSEEELTEEALQYGIQPAVAQVVERDKLEYKQFYMALVFLYQDRTETIPLIQGTAGLEYDITTAIRRVSRAELPVIGFLSGHGMATPESGMSTWTEPLRRHYQVRTVSVDSFAQVPPDIEALFIVGPTGGFTEWERYAVDQFIMRGGHTAWLMDAINADLQQSQQGMATAMELGMDSWLAHYGIRLRKALLMDRSNRPITMTSQRGIFQMREMVPYPFFPVVTSFNKENPMVKDLRDVTFFYASPIDTTFAPPDSTEWTVPDTINTWPSSPPDVRVEPILFSSEISSLQEDFFFIQANRAMASANFSGGPYPLAATITGQLRSAFATAPAVPDSIILPSHETGPVENRLVLVGDATFTRDEFMNYLQGANIPFLLNMADWLFQDEALIGIRAKEVDYRPLKEISNAARAFFKWLNILIPPILAILSGLFWWRYRRRTNRQQIISATATED